ncbi:stage V sporulation protein S [Desulfofundulus thermobenzoicus]|uniref:Stage V sporulation protein S n=1 Tax=Desulfofundulus thermobenzoicus TaxID=29376 RepID=A0A6N7IVY0_9FIRM|nr:stage V sporulation protein S [Desulfofundulus thermobenzoicus]MQL53298.1 stage V sporulation protein S [Desulfofundulus thermobenzoicus]
MELLRVSSRTDARKLCRAVYRVLRKNSGQAALQAIGAGAVNQAVKGVAVARGLAAPEGADLKAVPGLMKVEMNWIEKMAVQLHVFWR